MRLSLRDYFWVVVNAITDPGVLFNIGNAPISFQQSFLAGSVNLLVAAIAFFVRMISEFKSSGVSPVSKNPVVRHFNKLAENKGAALIASGVLTLFSAAAAFFAASISRLATASYLPAGMLACFGLVHMFRGIATGLKDRPAKCYLDAIAFLAATGGYLFANPALPILIKFGYGAVAGLAMYMAMNQQSAKGLKQPDIYFAAMSFIAAAVSSGVVAFGYALWASAYLSIEAMRKSGGVHQHILKLSRR